MQSCLKLLASLVPSNASVVELYAGSGTIGLHLLVECRCSWVRCVELNPACKAAFNESVKLLPAAERDRMDLYIAAAGEGPQHWLSDASVLVADPPRKGLDAAVLEMLCSVQDIAECSHLRMFLYVSCGYQALKRDCHALLACGHWQVVRATAFPFFPGTDSLEHVVVFGRKF